MDEKTVDRGGCAERGDAVALYLAQNLVGGELLVVEHKNGGTGKPLSVHLAPYGLAPSRVGHGEMDAVFGQVVPEDSRGEMPQCIEETVGHHLRLAAGAAGEIHEHRVVVVVGHRGTDEGRSLVPLLMPVVEAFGLFGADAHQGLECGALGP